jgi:hypothetical protein
MQSPSLYGLRQFAVETWLALRSPSTSAGQVCCVGCSKLAVFRITPPGTGGTKRAIPIKRHPHQRYRSEHQGIGVTVSTEAGKTLPSIIPSRPSRVAQVRRPRNTLFSLSIPLPVTRFSAHQQTGVPVLVVLTRQAERNPFASNPKRDASFPAVFTGRS